MRTIIQYNTKRKLINKLIKGLRGIRDGRDFGFMFAPYIPVQLEPVMFDDQLVGISSRYSTTQVNPNFYGEINIRGLNE